MFAGVIRCRSGGSRSGEKIRPDWLVAQGGDKSAMRLALRIREPRQQRLFALTARRIARSADADLLAVLGQDTLRLAGADEIDIDFRKQLRVEQRAVLCPARVVDRIARTQIVEPV